MVGLKCHSGHRANRYSITSWACASIKLGISIPCAFAVLAFTISSNPVGCSIGNSLGFMLFRICGDLGGRQIAVVLLARLVGRGWRQNQARLSDTFKLTSNRTMIHTGQPFALRVRDYLWSR